MISTLGLVHPGGTESYCLTIAHTLVKLGHDVTLFADELGTVAEHAANAGLDVARGPAELPRTCDAVLANDAITANLLRERYAETRLVYCLHSALFEVQHPPLEPGLIDAIVAPSERLAQHARALPLAVPVVRLRQPIDTAAFAPSRPPRRQPRAALLLSNYLDGDRRAALLDTWTAAGIACAQVGAPSRAALDVRPEIAKADIVVGKARAALEGMSCGKAVYVFDEFGGDGWVTPLNYAALEADNFAGQATDRLIDCQALAADLERYAPAMGWINRELAITHHDARRHAYELIEALRGPRPHRRADSTAGAEAARIVRRAWMMERRAIGSEQEVSALRGQIDDASSELAALRVEVAEVAAKRDALQVRAEAAEGRLATLLAMRRIQVARTVGRWLDRVRRRR